MASIYYSTSLIEKHNHCYFRQLETFIYQDGREQRSSAKEARTMQSINARVVSKS